MAKCVLIVKLEIVSSTRNAFSDPDYFSLASMATDWRRLVGAGRKQLRLAAFGCRL